MSLVLARIGMTVVETQGQKSPAATMSQQFVDTKSQASPGVPCPKYSPQKPSSFLAPDGCGNGRGLNTGTKVTTRFVSSSYKR